MQPAAGQTLRLRANRRRRPGNSNENLEVRRKLGVWGATINSPACRSQRRAIVQSGLCAQLPRAKEEIVIVLDKEGRLLSFPASQPRLLPKLSPQRASFL